MLLEREQRFAGHWATDPTLDEPGEKGAKVPPVRGTAGVGDVQRPKEGRYKLVKANARSGHIPRLAERNYH